MDKSQIIDMLKHLYEVDLDNCLMTHEMWIDMVAEALTNKNYLDELIDEHIKYLLAIEI